MEQRTCCVDGCLRHPRGRGLCSMHYQRWLKTGSTEVKRRPTVAERFWDKVNKDGPVPSYRPDLGPCWLWLGAITGTGYGNFVVAKGVFRAAHRFGYEMTRAKVSDDLEMDHLCRVRSCVNPDHLEPVPQAINTWRGLAPDIHNWLTEHCPQGHPYDLENTYWYGNNRKCRICRRDAVRRSEAKRRAKRQAAKGA